MTFDDSGLFFQPMPEYCVRVNRMEKAEPTACCDSHRDMGCRGGDMPDDFAVAMAYVPIQKDSSTYDDMQALCEGTLFPTLNKPFLGSDCR